MKRQFNVAGPCIPEWHYMLDPIKRNPEVVDLVESRAYFILHAPRQSGKTTLMIDLTKRFNAEGKYIALYCSLEMASVCHTVEDGIPAVVDCLCRALYRNPLLKQYVSVLQQFKTDVISRFQSALELLCEQLDRPLVVFFDEVDSLCDDLLISFLRQLRDGYVNRSMAPFPYSVALIGLRNLRDYRIQARGECQRLGTASPFNIIKESKTLNNFSTDEIATLYQQYTDETGQAFSKEVVDKVYELTCGQPWLVNAIACEIVEKICKKDTSILITPDMVVQAAQNIILRRDTHVDSLADKLNEPRIRKVIESVLTGGDIIDRLNPDFKYVLDLGLIKENNGVVTIANPIYNEVVRQTLNYIHQESKDSPQYTNHREFDYSYIEFIESEKECKIK